MKSKFFLILLIAAILMASMIFISCGNPNCPRDGDCKMTGHNCYKNSGPSIFGGKSKFDCLPGLLNTSNCKCE